MFAVLHIQVKVQLVNRKKYKKGGVPMERRMYEEPTVAVVTFESDDVITTSGNRDWFEAED